MALITCPGCGAQIADVAPACPHCGRPNAPNPYQTPQAGGPPPGYPGGPPPYGAPDPRSTVSIPAILLIVLGGLEIAVALLSIVMSLAQGPQEPPPNLPAEYRQFFEQSQKYGVVAPLIGMVGAVLLVFGGLKMKSCENYGLAVAASIVAMIPCITPSLCCCLGIPVGIWSLIVLMKPDVKAAFGGGMGPPGGPPGYPPQQPV